MPGNVCGHEETAVKKTGTDSALRELIIWVGPARGGGQKRQKDHVEEANWLGAVEAIRLKAGKNN